MRAPITTIVTIFALLSMTFHKLTEGAKLNLPFQQLTSGSYTTADHILPKPALHVNARSSAHLREIIRNRVRISIGKKAAKILAFFS